MNAKISYKHQKVEVSIQFTIPSYKK